MFRLLRYIVLLLIIIAIGFGVYGWISRVSILERFFSQRFNSKVTIEDVKLGWGKLTIEGLYIDNPSSSVLPYNFRTDVIIIESSPFTLWQKRVQIDRIKVQNPTIGIQLNNSSGTENNWASFLNSLPFNGNRTFIVKNLTILNLKFDVIRSNGKPLTVPMIPYLEFKNLGGEEGLTLSQLSRVIFQTILQTLSRKAHLGAILDNVVELPSSLLDGVTSTLPLEKVKGVLNEGLDMIRRKSQEASEFLHDLFSRN